MHLLLMFEYGRNLSVWLMIEIILSITSSFCIDVIHSYSDRKKINRRKALVRHMRYEVLSAVFTVLAS